MFEFTLLCPVGNSLEAPIDPRRVLIGNRLQHDELAIGSVQNIVLGLADLRIARAGGLLVSWRLMKPLAACSFITNGTNGSLPSSP